MTSVLFSTGSVQSLAEDEFKEPSSYEFLALTLSRFAGFPHFFPQLLKAPSFFLFIHMRRFTRFCTGSITNTKNLNQRFSVVAEF